MRFSVFLTSAAVLIAAMFGSSDRAAATTQAEAVKLCKKNPSCSMTKHKGYVGIKVGSNEIVCPPKGACNCLICSPPARTQPGGKGGKGNVVGVLRGSSASGSSGVEGVAGSSGPVVGVRPSAITGGVKSTPRSGPGGPIQKDSGRR